MVYSLHFSPKENAQREKTNYDTDNTNNNTNYEANVNCGLLLSIGTLFRLFMIHTLQIAFVFMRFSYLAIFRLFISSCCCDIDSCVFLSRLLFYSSTVAVSALFAFCILRYLLGIFRLIQFTLWFGL